MHKRWLNTLTGAVSLIALTYFSTFGSVYAQNINLPDIGSSADAILSIEDEKRLGKAFLRNVRQYYKIVEDPLIEDYIQGLGNRLTSHIEGIKFDFNFFIVDEPGINAFAGPGGNIGINTGTILATESESELASVLAHEIAHITQRHLQRSFEKANKLNLPTAAGVIAAILLGSRDVEVSEALLMASIANSTQTQINFTRDHEREADRIGMNLLTDAEYDPKAMPIFFERLQKTTLGSRVVPEFLSTHPITLNRISDSRNRAEQYPDYKGNKNVNFYIIQSRLQVNNKKQGKTNLKKFEQLQKNEAGVDLFAKKYAYALALLEHEKFDQARKIINTLIKDDQERVPYLLTQANIEIKAGQIDKAIKYLSAALNLYPNNSPLTILYTKILLDDNQTKLSKQLLKEQLRHNPSNPALYKLLAHAEKKDGSSSAAFQALAEHDYLYGRTRLAISHLQMALRQLDTQKYTRTRIEARLEEFKKEALLEQEMQEKE